VIDLSPAARFVEATKRSLARTNRLDPVNSSTRHIALFVSSFIPVDIVKTFSLSGISLTVDDESVLQCQGLPDKARRLLMALAIPIPGGDGFGDAISEDEGIQAFAKETAELR
jgi:hypothetical protein